MRPIRLALVGGGWRAAFFARIANALPERFELTGSCLRDGDKARLWAQRYGGRACTAPEELLTDKPDYLVLSIARDAAAEKLMSLMKLGVPLLCETPPAWNREDLARVWKAAQETGTPVAVAEQYPDWPLYRAWQRVVDEGRIGRVSNLNISAVHSYHAIALIRRFLGAGMAGAEIRARRFSFPVRVTDSRAGLIKDGPVENAVRDRATIVFEGGQTAFFDFSSVQYHSFIRARHLNIQGENGEIDDLTLRYMNAEGLPMAETLTRMERGANHNAPASLMGLTLGGRWVYENPFAAAPGLNDDEIAVASCMARMAENRAYSLRDGLQDAWLGLLLEEALADPDRPVRGVHMPWQD